MIFKNIALFFFLILFHCNGFIHAQNIENTSKGTSWSRSSENEIYIQTNKGIYETGEDLWFKAYVLDSHFLQPADTDRTLFLILEKNDEECQVWEEKYEIINGFSEGHVYLSDTLSSGTYLLKAFSQNSIHNSLNGFKAVRKIIIVDSIAEYSPKTNIAKDTLGTFDLFPEGGNLVYGLLNRLAFKAVGTSGNPITVEGQLFENGEPILNLKSLHDGMGSLNFKPQQGKVYSIGLTGKDDGSAFSLPRILNEGVLLRTESNHGENLSIDIKCTKLYKGKRFFLRLKHRGVTYGKAEGVLKDSLRIDLPLENIPQGIAEITLFDSEQRPVAERLIYLNTQKKLNISTELSDDGIFGLRQKVTLKIKTTDETGNPTQSHLGISVFDHVFENKSDTKTILSHYHLSTQLKGNIHNPSYYFDSENSDRFGKLDLLMLTQGWRRYLWNSDTSGGQRKEQNLITDDLVGKITVKKRQKTDFPTPAIMAYNPSTEGKSDIIIPDSLYNFVVTPEHLKMGEKGMLYLRLMAKKRHLFQIDLKNNGFQQFREITKGNFSYPTVGYKKLPNNLPSSFEGNRDLVQLDEVELKSKRKVVHRQKYMGKLDSILKSATPDYVCKYNILNCEYHVFDKDNKKPVEGEIYLYMEIYNDDAQRWEPGHIKLSSATYFRNPPLPPYRYPSYSDEDLLELFNIIRIKGYYGHREFYQPKYDKEIDHFPDYRNTLLWNPWVITDEEGKATLEFFCSDISTTFKGVIEGVDGNGYLGSHDFSLQVKN